MIFMARHGETTYNAERRFQGWSPKAVVTAYAGVSSGPSAINAARTPARQRR